MKPVIRNMLRNISFAKALILAGILVLISIFTFNKIIQNQRLEIFQKYSDITLPPVYTIKQNTAGTSNYSTDVVLVFGFDQKNYESFLKLNKINNSSANRNRQTHWLSNKSILSRKIIINSNTTVLEFIHTKQKTLKFRYQQK